MKKKKIINDPVYGFMTVPNRFILDLINHPFVQRLRRIKQLGLTDFVYPGALHTRFHHALGAMYLMKETLDNLREKGVVIKDDEYQATLIAILLHDVGHAPYSHALENVLLENISHEDVGLLIIKRLNSEFSGGLDLAIEIFEDRYHRRFLHQLIASQLDIDRLDYLNRDSFFTGVTEGKIGSERIIKLLNVHHDNLVVEEKGIYSIENFLGARRLMYWQVYLHKTTVGAEAMLKQIIKRAKALCDENQDLPMCSAALQTILSGKPPLEALQTNDDLLTAYCELDDNDIMMSIKNWTRCDDPVLKLLCQMLIKRELFSVEITEAPPLDSKVEFLIEQVASSFSISKELAKYFVVSGMKSNSAYIGGGQKINILTKKGEITDIEDASDLPNITAMRKIVKKYYLCWPKAIYL